MYTMIETVSFRNAGNDLQQRMKDDLLSVRTSSDIIVPADKTRNLYRMSANKYNALLTENVTNV